MIATHVLRSVAVEHLIQPGHPYTTPDLTANLVLRVIFAIISSCLLWVPFRLLYRNGEFAAVVFIIAVAIFNLRTVVNSLIWHDDNWDAWWDGVGLCDLEVYITLPLETIYAAAILVIMRHLAQQFANLRVTAMSRQERHRRYLIEALIIFPVPVIQIIFTWFDLSNRFSVLTLVGCTAELDGSLPLLLVYNMPSALFAIASVPYAFLTWKRYRAISKTTRPALASDGAAVARANRTKRRLYLMSLSILIPYVPIEIAFLARNIITSDLNGYDYHHIHYGASPYPWSAIFFVPSWQVPFVVMNQPWIPIITTLPIVWFFGLTIDAIKMYRRAAVSVGLGRCFPLLKEPYDPDSRYNSRGINETKSTWFSSLVSKRKSSVAENRPSISLNERPSLSNTLHQRPFLPNTHHQAIISFTGPAIPPRHSSRNKGSFLIRSETWRNLSVRLPSIPGSLPSIFSSSRQKTESSINISNNHNSNGSGNRVRDDVEAAAIPLQIMDFSGGCSSAAGTQGTLPSLHVHKRSEMDGRHMYAREGSKTDTRDSDFHSLSEGSYFPAAAVVHHGIGGGPNVREASYVDGSSNLGRPISRAANGFYRIGVVGRASRQPSTEPGNMTF